MRNNKGQTLVVFVLLLPFILAVMGLIIDGGLLHFEKRKLDNNVKDAIEYGLNNIDLEEQQLKNKIETLLIENIDDIQNMSIYISTNHIKVNIKKIRKSLFNILLDHTQYTVLSSYDGYINNGNIEIIKE